jgi:hypothetical protein
VRKFKVVALTLALVASGYDAFLVCTLDPRELGLDGYDAEPRNFVIDGGP